MSWIDVLNDYYHHTAIGHGKLTSTEIAGDRIVVLGCYATTLWTRIPFIGRTSMAPWRASFLGKNYFDCSVFDSGGGRESSKGLYESVPDPRLPLFKERNEVGEIKGETVEVILFEVDPTFFVARER